MFIDCLGATTLFSTRAVCVMCCAYAVAVSYTVRVRTARRRENEIQKSFGKADTYLYIIIIYTHICTRIGT